MSEKEPQEMKTIKEIFKAPGRKDKTIGVIVDISGAQKMGQNEEQDFQTKIKVIDQSYNFNSQDIPDGTKPYLHVSIYSKTFEDSPNVKSIGDIIYLKRFKFSKYENGNDVYLSAITLGNQSQWKIYSAIEQDNQLCYQRNIKSDQNEKSSEKLILLLTQLREFNKIFFSQNSLLNMDWYGLKYPKLKQDQNDFDMVLKFQQKIDIQDQHGLKTYRLIDSQSNEYYLQFRILDIQKNDLVKIRSVLKIVPTNNIILQKRSNILMIPSFFYDNLNFEKIEYRFFYSQKQILDGADNIHMTFKHAIGQYDTKTKFLSYIKKQYREDNETKDLTQLSDLLKAEDLLKSNGNTPKELQRKHRIQCYIFDILPDNLDQAVQYYSLKNNQIYDLSNQEAQNMNCYKIWNITLGVKDLSIDIDPRFFELQIFSFDNNPINIFPDFSLDKIEPQNPQFNKKYQKIVQQLIETNNLQNLCEFIVEPLINEKNVIFRVVDTIFKKS